VVLDSAVTIGYDTPWRQVHALLLEAAKAVAEIRSEPAPYVVQTALSDYRGAPSEPEIVRESDWCAPPSAREDR